MNDIVPTPIPPAGPAENDDEKKARIKELRAYAEVISRKNDRLASALVGARTELAALHEEIERLSVTPLNYGIVLGVIAMERQADIWLSGRKIRATIAKDVVASRLVPGQEVRLNEHLVVVQAGDLIETGDVVTVKEIIDSQKVLVIVRNEDEQVLNLAETLQRRPPRVGDALVADTRAGIAHRRILRAEVEELLLEEVPDITYAQIGGLAGQIEQIKDAIELPFKHPKLYREHDLKPPRGVLLYGPPGCGKTLIAKAVAASLTRTSQERGTIGALSQKDEHAYFLNIKGPQLLNKYVGETERQIRLIFARAREKAATGMPVVIFFDEMESLFRTRGTGKSSDVETTVVPQLLAEIDGVEELDNVVIIGASNREDMIDPAILRPGRLDVKIRIERPDRQGAREILAIYLTSRLPLDSGEIAAAGSPEEAANALIDAVVERLYERSERNEFVELTYSSGQRQMLYISDFVSGAMLANIVDRAKKNAIKDFLATSTRGITRAHLLAAVAAETAENEELPNTTNPDEWARACGRRGEKIVQMRTITHGVEARGKTLHPGAEPKMKAAENE